MLAYLLAHVHSYIGFAVCVQTYVCFIFGVDFAIQIKVYRKILFYDLSKYTHTHSHSQFICVINICVWSWGIRLYCVYV